MQERARLVVERTRTRICWVIDLLVKGAFCMDLFMNECVGIMSASSFAGYLAWMMEVEGRMRYIVASLGCIFALLLL